MNILIVSHLYPTPNDSVPGIFVHQQAQALQDRGHSVRVLSPTPYVPSVPYLPDRWARFRDTPDHSRIDGVDVSYPTYLSLPSYHTLPLVAKSVRRSIDRAIPNLTSRSSFTPDVINAHVPLPDGYACLPAAQRRNIPLVTTVHGASVYTSARNPLCRKQIGGVFDASEEVIFNSGVLLGEAESHFQNLSNAQVVHNGVQLDVVKSAPTASLSDTFPEDRIVVSSVGTLIDRKNHSVVIDAISEIESDKRPYYLIIGSGPNRNLLEQRIKSKGIEDFVHFTGYVPRHKHVLSKLKAADVMALPSTEEAFGIAYIEAMACGCPVIGCEGEGPSEFVDHGETGYLVSPNDPEAIEKILVDLLENQTKVRRMGKNASEYVRNNLTWAENARKNERIYRSAVESNLRR
ncbi:glycosyltransferase family 4 protein [Halorubrum sp. ASP121]|uniref:glycosyltransferase n=1 Tax=Halorubrum sp. ASP121 TaxID=1855858 RepID=UPI0010F77E1A|nr:glycosyltransferase [Halorubrum sp. ASP121]TKX48932.1 glycosyltransferase family 4 protein [Halorubrum sp. ASP121]